MKRSLFSIAIFAFLLAGAGITRAAEERELVLLAGQSNAVGFDADPAELPAEPADKDVLFWWRCGDPPPDDHDTTSGRHWTHLQVQPRGTPLERTSNEPGEATFKLSRQYGNFRSPEGGFGPEMGFTREWRREEKKPLAVIKVAFSGTGMRTDWNPTDPEDGGACYRALVSETKAAIAAAKEEGVTLHLRALLWVQGESDATANTAPDYERALTAMLKALRQDLDAPQLLALLAVNTHFGNDKNPYMPQIIAAQQAIAAKDSLCAYVDTADAETLLPSRTHFTAAGTLAVGRKFAVALRQLEAGKPLK